MKRFCYILFSASVAFSTVSCSDDENGGQYLVPNSITVVSSNVSNLPPAAGAGRIVVSAPSGITATSTAAWCTATVDGDTVNISVQPNIHHSGRATAVVVRSGSDSVNVIVQQRGVVYEYSSSSFGFTNSASTAKRYILCNTPFAVEASADWITPSVEGDSIVVSVSENTTGHLRSGSVKCSIGSYTEVIPVVQADFAGNIEGAYSIAFNDIKGAASSAVFNINISSSTMTIKRGTNTFEFPLAYDESTCTLRMKSGQYAGSNKFGTTFFYTAFTVKPVNGAYSTWSEYSTGYTASFIPVYDETEGRVKLTLSGKLVDKDIYAFGLKGFTSKTCAKAYDDGNTLQYYFGNPVLTQTLAQ